MDAGKAATLAGKESLFLWSGDPLTGLPYAPMRGSSQRGNPSPHKNSIFYISSMLRSYAATLTYVLSLTITIL
jgi:hypothetical protein